jgi:hypothetical protein
MTLLTEESFSYESVQGLYSPYSKVMNSLSCDFGHFSSLDFYMSPS